MASVHSPIRKFLKPILFRIFGRSLYDHFLAQAKWRDIELSLVEEPEMAVLPALLKPTDTCLDIGANFAYYTVRLARLCPQGKVIAFEPIPSTFKIMRKLVKKSGSRNVEIHNLGVGDKNEIVVFELPLQEIGTPSAGQAHIQGRDNSLKGGEDLYSFEKKESIRCQIVKLDDFLKIEALDFVKIDIEGAELFALNGMSALLKRHRPIILLEICSFFLRGFGQSLEKALEQFTALNYSVFELDPDRGGKIRAVKGLPDGNKNYFLLPTENLERFRSIL